MSNRLIVKPRAAWTDYTPTGPWADGTIVTRNADGVGFTYLEAYNALVINPNLSASVKDSNNFIIKNLPTPSVGTDVANKNYVDAHSGGGGLADAPSDGSLYGRLNAAWTKAVPLAGGTMTGLLTLSGIPSVTNGAATKGYVDGAVPTPSSTTPAMDGTGAAGSSALYARGDHVHPTDSTRAPLASPTFTGTPAAPTPATADNSTTIATTAFVKAQSYITTITLSGDISGSGSSAITTTLATVNSNVGTFQGITVNAKGLVTAAVAQGYITGNQTITLSGDVTGSGATSIASTVAKLQGNGVSTTAPTGGQVLTWNGGTNLWTPTTPSAAGAGGTSGQIQWNNGGAFGGFTMGGDATLVTSTGALTLATVNSNIGTFQGLTVNAKGLVTAAASIASTTIPLADDPTGVIGTSTNFARADHVHPLTTPWGCGRLGATGTTTVNFYPYNGDLVKINGIVYRIPSSGVVGTSTSTFVNQVGGQALAASTLYYVYIFNNSGTLALNFNSQTLAGGNHGRSGTTGNIGVEVLNTAGGDAYTLVGMVYMNPSSQFVDNGSYRGVISWFNRKNQALGMGLGNQTTTAVSAGYVSLMGANQAILLSWADEEVSGYLNGQTAVSVSGNTGGVAFSYDSTSTNIMQPMYIYLTAPNYAPTTIAFTYPMPEGAHSYYIVGFASINTNPGSMTLYNSTMWMSTRA